MRKMITALVVGAIMGLLVPAVQADSVTVTLTRTGAVGATAAYSEPINISGYLERVEFNSASDGATNTFTLATYKGTTAQQKFVEFSTASTGTQYKVVSPRVVGTTIAGVALDAVATGTNQATQVLSVPYERMMIGGNVKLALSPALTNTTTTVEAVLYYERAKK